MIKTTMIKVSQKSLNIDVLDELYSALEEETLSPFLEKGIEGFEAWAVEEGNVFYFGKMKDSKR